MKRCEYCHGPLTLRRRLTEWIAEWECAACRLVMLR